MTPIEFKAWRQSQSLTQPQAAERLGISRPTVARWESGASPIPDDIATRLGCPTPVIQSVEPVPAVKATVDTKGYDPIADGLKPGPTTNAIYGASTHWDTRAPGPGWQRVPGGIRIVNASIPNPINYEPPDWAGWRGVVTADGRVFDQESGRLMGRCSTARRPSLKLVEA